MTRLTEQRLRQESLDLEMVWFDSLEQQQTAFEEDRRNACLRHERPEIPRLMQALATVRK